MNIKQIGIGVVCAAFTALTAYTVYTYGYLGWLRVETANAMGITLFVDLAISLTLVAIWMGRDAREHNISVVPYLLLTLFFGSVGPLLYLVRRFSNEPARQLHAAAGVRN
jgi:hypothetical protein